MNAMKKIGFSVLTNILVFLSAIIGVWQFCRTIIIALIEAQFIQRTVTGLKYALIIIIPGYFLLFEKELEAGWRWLTSIVVVLVLILLSKLINMLADLISIGIECIFDFLDAEFVLSWLVETSDNFVTDYLYRSPNGIKVGERILAFPILYLVYYMNTLFNILIKIIAALLYPALAVVFGYLTWIECFGSDPVYDFTSALLYCNLLLVAVAIGAALFIAYHFAKAFGIARNTASIFEDMLSTNHYAVKMWNGHSAVVLHGDNTDNTHNIVEAEDK